MPRKENPGPLSAQQQQDLVSEGIDNFELPKSLVQKIAKSAVPDNTKLQKEVILSLVKGSTVFINYLAATAHDVAQSKQHKSISASDVLKALEMIDLGDLVEPLTAELQVYRDQGNNKSSGGARRASTASSALPTPATTAATANGKQSAVAAANSSSISSSGKSNSNNKGKGRAGDPSVSVGGVETLPPPFTSAPLVHKHFPPGDRDSSTTAPGAGAERNESEDLSAAINRASAATEEAMDVDYDGESGARGDVDGDGGDADMNEEEAEDEQEEEEELEDVVETEAQELREDAMGVEQRGTATEHKS
ncbi:hypothetical protein GYMLUDRAFT_45493 [Collybiopsis luxurians FD-317 M1]|uniref:DNA polymerase epsilon subunit D n=1 Tax=Collybiopsis luxurians FD-317 M1 TaxID=944289 RepID=A0A0D0CRM8_9AGAR|nr:hypothetical protein GYMLUDRAFT_45493 [Collybiopsis luxurians FD-317 M1]